MPDHADSCGKTGGAIGLSCKLDCTCWCHKPDPLRQRAERAAQAIAVPFFAPQMLRKNLLVNVIERQFADVRELVEACESGLEALISVYLSEFETHRNPTPQNDVPEVSQMRAALAKWREL